MFIYLITNNINHKMYGGQTVNPLYKRWSAHKKAVGKFDHPLYRAMAKYGVENFRIEIVDWAASIEELNQLEEELIAKFDLTNREKGYNLEAGGKNKVCGIETRKKQSEAHKGHKLPEEQKKKIGEGSRNAWLNPSYREAQRLARKDFKMSDEAKAKISQSKMGKPISEEHKRKLFEGKHRKGNQPHSEETKRKIAESVKASHRKRIENQMRIN